LEDYQRLNGKNAMPAIVLTKLIAASSQHIVLEYDQIATSIDAGQIGPLVSALCDRKGVVGADSVVIVRARQSDLVECRPFRCDGKPSNLRIGAALCVARYFMENHARDQINVGIVDRYGTAKRLKAPYAYIWQVELSDVPCGIPSRAVVQSPAVSASVQILKALGLVSLVDCGGLRFVVLLRDKDFPPREHLQSAATRAFAVLDGAVAITFAANPRDKEISIISFNPLTSQAVQGSASGAVSAAVSGISAGRLSSGDAIRIQMDRGAAIVNINTSKEPWTARISIPVMLALTGSVNWDSARLGNALSGNLNMDELREYDDVTQSNIGHLH
jgi:diaminopimelate epimerase